jgi:hypothetical protein
VRRLALSAGASFLCLRPSERSFSRWVAVVFFSSSAAATAFAAPVAGLFPSGSFSRVPFCAVLGGAFRFPARWLFFLLSLVSVPASGRHCRGRGVQALEETSRDSPSEWRSPIWGLVPLFLCDWGSRTYGEAISAPLRRVAVRQHPLCGIAPTALLSDRLKIIVTSW